MVAGGSAGDNGEERPDTAAPWDSPSQRVCHHTGQGGSRKRRVEREITSVPKCSRTSIEGRIQATQPSHVGLGSFLPSTTVWRDAIIFKHFSVWKVPGLLVLEVK